MKNTILFAAILAFASATRAQVSCSANVPAEACKIVSHVMSEPEVGVTGLKNMPVSVEILTHDEFVIRKQEIENHDEGVRFDCHDPAFWRECTGSRKPQIFRMFWTDGMLFTRDYRSESEFPTKIIISVSEFVSVRTEANPVGKLDFDKILNTRIFIEGFYQGLVAMSERDDRILRSEAK